MNMSVSNLVAPFSVFIETEEGVIPLTPSGAIWEGGNIAVTLVPSSPDVLKISLSAPQTAVKRVHLRWKSEGESGNSASGVRILGDHWERGYGDLEWRGLVPERVLPWYFLYQQNNITQGLGVATNPAAVCHFQVDPDGVSLFCDVRSGGVGVKLGEQKLLMATLVSYAGDEGESAFSVARQFCKRLCATPRLPKMPVYGFNDWYYAYGNNSAETIFRDAQILAKLAPAGENRPFQVIDAGWFPGKGCNGGPYVAGNENFPDMASLAQKIKDINVRPGIWVRPLITQDNVPESWRQATPVHSDRGILLDPTVPEVLELVRTDIHRMVSEWGYELVKHDFTTYDITGCWGFQMDKTFTGSTPDGCHFADQTRTTAEIIRNLYNVIREAAGDALLIGCNTVGHLGAGLFELQRTGDDTSGHEWERTRKMGVNTLAFRMSQHDTFFAVDADCVGLTKQVPWELNRQWLDLLARSGTPLFVSADPTALGPEQEEALRTAFARAATPQPLAEPLDWQDTTCPTLWKIGRETHRYHWINGM